MPDPLLITGNININNIDTKVVGELSGLRLRLSINVPIVVSTCQIEFNFPSDYLVETG